MQDTKNKIVQFLRWSEQYTKTDMLYLAKGGFWITFGRVISAGSGFLLTLLLANTISKEALGNYKFVQSFAGIIMSFSLTGMGAAIIQSVARGNDGVIREGFKTFLSWSVLMTAIAWGSAIYYFLNGNIVLGWSLVVIGITLPLQAGGFFSPFLIGKKEFKTETIFGVVCTIVPLLATGVTALFTDVTSFLVLAFFGTSAFVGMIFYHITLKRYNPPRETEVKALTYGKHLSVMNILGSISLQLDRLLVFHYLGAAQMALYAVALAAPQQLRFGSKLLATMALPKLSGTDPAPIYKTLPRKALLVFCGSLLITFVYIMLAPLFFKLFFPTYGDAIIYSQVFALVILFFPAALFQQFLVGQMQQKWLYILQTSIPFVKIVLLFIFLPLYGIWGALISILGMEVVRMITILSIFFKLSKDSQKLTQSSDVL
ncbi:MAG: oligosaccharide flippase family protein [Candidatus Campbellbacteria bacterium]|nr:oligosaccharide flippase family protein [Candidatus Campbellbacteria bacterium]